MWSLFRVENEHCSNVGHFRASRDVPLPYDLSSSPEISSRPSADHERGKRVDEEQPSPHLRRMSTAPMPEREPGDSGAKLDRRDTRSSTRRRRATSYSEEQRPSPLARGLTRVGTIIRTAHAQDFEKKRKPELGQSTDGVKEEDDDSDDSDDERDERSGTASSGGDEEDAIVHEEDEQDLQQVREDVGIGRAGAAYDADGAISPTGGRAS